MPIDSVMISMATGVLPPRCSYVTTRCHYHDDGASRFSAGHAVSMRWLKMPLLIVYCRGDH